MNKEKHADAAKRITDRRGFFKQFFVDAVCLVDECLGRPQMRISDLKQAPEAVVRTLAPAFNPKRPCRVEDNGLLSVKGDRGQEEPLCGLDAIDAAVFNCFGTSMTIDEISGVIERRYDLDRETAFVRVRTLFFFLAERMICFPEKPGDGNE